MLRRGPRFAAYRGRDAALGQHLTHTPVVQDESANAREFFPISSRQAPC
jgi:hypothetical protein